MNHFSHRQAENRSKLCLSVHIKDLLMKKTLLSLVSLMVATLAMAQVRVATPNTELILNAEPGQELQIVYFGNRLCDADVANLQAAGAPNHNAYPPYGLWCASEAALGVTHADGNLSTVLKVEGIRTVDEPTAKVTRIRLKDTVYPFCHSLLPCIPRCGYDRDMDRDREPEEEAGEADPFRFGLPSYPRR